MRIVRVLPDVLALGRSFDYVVPDSWEEPVGVGTRIRISLHGRRVGGWVLEDDVEAGPGLELKPLAKHSGMGPPPHVVALAEWAAWRWAGPLGALLTVASPDRVVRAPERPAPALRATGAPQGPLASVAAEALGAGAGPALLRVPPATDLLPVLEAALEVTSGPVLVLVPNLGWAERLRERLARRGVRVARSWAQAAGGWPVVVGSRGAAFSPAPRLGAAVVLDAHDEAYREERAPRFDAARVVAERAARDGAPFLATSAVPTASQVHDWSTFELPAHEERSGWPRLHVIDRRADDPRTGLYSEELVTMVRACPGRVVVVFNRRGRARLLACGRCGELVRCETCGRAMAESGGRLACAACGAERPFLCAACGHLVLKALRVGVSRVREELEALLSTEVAEVTGSEPGEGDARVVVGTEAVLHRVRSAAMVVFLDFDLHLLAPRMSATEEALGLLARSGRLVGGRSARGAGIVVVQTRIAGHEVLEAATLGNPGPLIERELGLRRELSLPPFGALGELSGPGAGELFGSLGLDGSPLGGDRWLVRARDHQALCDRLAAAPRPRERVRIVVDPPGL